MPDITKIVKKYVVMFSFVFLPTFSFFNFDFPSLFNLKKDSEQESVVSSDNLEDNIDVSNTVRVDDTTELIQEEDVLGIYDKNIVISARPRAWGGHALITFSPPEDPVINISSQNSTDEITVKVYRTNIDTFLNALVRDENDLLVNKVDTAQMSLEAELSFTPEKRDELTPHD
ncbi:MAG: hypothetical protein KC414_14890, partial [Romboutsia sp.]|nr:hypothetical protein [Romboutsia sp.]